MKKICEIFEISSGKLAHDIKRGIFSDVKWKNGGNDFIYQYQPSQNI